MNAGISKFLEEVACRRNVLLYADDLADRARALLADATVVGSVEIGTKIEGGVIELTTRDELTQTLQVQRMNTLDEQTRKALIALGWAPPVEGAKVDDLLSRIDEAIKRITTGSAPMRVPAEQTDPDLVLAECRALLRVRHVRLQVWIGDMPESNGRTNHTAILHRGELHEGYTIARSQYPDRVRYEADRVRWLIGELATEPHILDYDGDKVTPCHLCGGLGVKNGKPCWGLNFQGTVHATLKRGES